MIPAAFSYTRAASLSDAVAAVGGGAKVIAGGQSLLSLMKLRLASPDKLVDIGRLTELKGYRSSPDGGVEIGAMTTYAEWQAATKFPGVAEAIELIADVQVRNRGTIGGSIAHADPASDVPAIALAFEGSAVLRGPGGERVVPLRGFFKGPFQTDIRPDEILVAIRRGPVPAGGGFCLSQACPAGVGLRDRRRGCRHRDERRDDLARPRSASPVSMRHAYRAEDVEKALIGSDGSDAAVEAAAAQVNEDVEPLSDIHADGEYRAAMAVVYTRRAIEGALGR